MQLKKCAVAGVLITLCLSTDSWCHYIPEKKINLRDRKNGASSNSEQIQICGNQLTTFIIEACGGIVGPVSQANSSRGSVKTKITEDCCDRKCSTDYIQKYCGGTPLFTSNESLRGKLLSKFTRNRSTGFRDNDKLSDKQNNEGISEVRVREKKNGKRKWVKSKKRKRSFKWKCAYKSFGHYLLKLDREVRVRDNTVKDQNNINRMWPSLQIGTISPEIDKFGGQPIVVVKKNKSNPV